jgi:hypothetical protein
MPSKTSAIRVRAAERSAQIMELRREGATYSAIASKIGITTARAHQVVLAELRRAHAAAAEATAAMVALELDRLDALTAACWPLAIEGDLRAVDRVLRIMARRAALLGLDHESHRGTQVAEESLSSPALLLVPPKMSLEEWQDMVKQYQRDREPS